MVQTVNCDILLYADASGLLFQNTNINTIEHQLNENFSNVCDCGSQICGKQNKIHSDAPTYKCKKHHKLNISYGRANS